MLKKIFSASFKLMIVALAFLISACAGSPQQGGGVSQGISASEAKSVKETLIVKVLDIGQGDAILLCAGGENILIDTGDTSARDKLVQELNIAGVKKIDKVIASHPHADHIGGMAAVLSNFEVGEVLDNGMPSTSPVWRGYMKTMKSKNIPRRNLVRGEKIAFKGGELEVLFPTAELVQAGQNKGYQHHPNDESVCLMLTYGKFSMLFTGDLEKKGEKELADFYGERLKCNVLNSPHHGSKTSSSPPFLRASAPEAVVISLGAGNSYGHPHDATLKKYALLKANVYRTDELGTVTITTDGETYKIGGAKDASVS